MADSRTVSGSVDVSHDERHSVAFKLMEKIAYSEFDDRGKEQNSRDYWLKLYVECVNATYRSLPVHLKDR